MACAKVMFFKPNTFSSYISAEKVSRFLLRDHTLQRKLDQFLIATEVPTQVVIEKDGESALAMNCGTCFPCSSTKPLSYDSFDVVSEWATDVPLQVQIMFENFINKASLRKAEDKISFFLKKLTTLYATFDTLLHTFNKHYGGVIQEANSDELILGYRSVETVFDVTSNVGATMSLKIAENRLRKRATKEDLYYSTYLKKYPLLYHAIGEVDEKTHYVRLRDCYIIFMVDNLVRLRFNHDPDRGENQSGQINPLPITIQGLPRNAEVTQNWHDLDICNRTDNCKCKEPKILSKTDMPKVLTSLRKEEKEVKDKFERLNTWGIQCLWNTITEYGEVIFVFERNCSPA